jgi:hypothetical protein
MQDVPGPVANLLIDVDGYIGNFGTADVAAAVVA